MVQLAANPAAEATVVTIDPGTPNPSRYGEAVGFVAHVDAAAILPELAVGVFQVGPAITGFVTFTVDGVDQSPVAVGGDATAGFTAAFTTSTLKPGSHHVTARYGGDANYNPSPTSAAVTQTVAKVATTTNLQPGTPNPSAVGQTVTFNVSMDPQQFTGHQPVGNFVLYVDGKAVQSVPLGGTGSGYFATFRYAFPTAGPHQVAAMYAGDAEYAASPMSPAVMQTVNTPASRGPTVTVVTRYGYHWTPTEIVIGFSAPLDPARAQNVANYSLRLAGSCAVVPILAARYNPATFQVTIIPAKLLPLKNTYILTVRGTPPAGLTDTNGRYLVGSPTGQPGTNFVTRVTYKNLSWAPAPPLPPVILTAARKLPAGPAARFRR
ncbi:MAG: Ig-like domain-containing protein [Isosphaeraceae bacterium]